MAEKIKITPSELQAQAAEMKALESEFSALFSGVSSELKRVNTSWGPFLSRNFDGKISSAQKSFTQITQELMNGAKVAETCATTFESVDSLLAKNGYGEETEKGAYGVTATVSPVAKPTPHIIAGILSLVSPITGLLYITSGIYAGKTPSFFDHSRSPSASTSADWLGYEVSDGNPGVTAWIGKASAEAQNEWGYAGVNGYLGKAEASAKADFGTLKTSKKKEYKDGKWTEKSKTEYVIAEAGASASASILEGDIEGGLGSDMLGLEGEAELVIGTAKAEAKGKFSVSEDGVTAKVDGKAMVAAVEGEAKGTINILGLEITAKAGGYAGAVGVEGKIGIEDGKFVMKGGAAALVGGSIGLEIGFNDEGWDNFVDFVTFWD